MRCHRTQIQGFTFVELLVVFALVAMIIGFAVTGFQNYARYQEYVQAVTSVRANLTEARVRARAAEEGQAHGVKILTNSTVRFLGSVYSAGVSTNQVDTYNNIQIIPVLTGGATTIVFSSLTGLPSATGSVMVVGTAHVATTTIEISGTGVIQ